MPHPPFYCGRLLKTNARLKTVLLQVRCETCLNHRIITAEILGNINYHCQRIADKIGIPNGKNSPPWPHAAFKRIYNFPLI
jgi:hypothetical protein